MLWARAMVNVVLTNTLPFLDEAPADVVGKAFGCVQWVLKKAGFPLHEEIDPRLIRNTVRILADAVVRTPYGQPLELQYPLLVTISGSSYCPFRCTNCYSDSGTHRVSEGRSWTPWHDAVAHSPVPFVFLTGGEPMADPHIEETAERFLSAGKWVYVSSNASVARLLEPNRRYPHSLFLCLPLWGQSAQHDALRGPGSFRRLCENLQMLTANDLSGNLLVVMSNNDLGVIDTVSDLASKYRIRSIRLNRKVSVGRENADSLAVDEAFMSVLRHKVRALRRRVSTLTIDLPETRTHSRYPALLRWLGIPAFQSCSAGQWMMHLDDRGRAYPCYTFEGTQHYDDLRPESLAERWINVRRGRERLSYADACVGEAYSQGVQSQVLTVKSGSAA